MLSPAETISPWAVDVRDLHKQYGGHEAVRGVSFSVARGEVFGLLGPNGAGKTTTLECVLGLRRPDAGRIHVCGIDALADPRRVKARVGAQLQSTALQDRITPREALGLFGAFYGRHVAPAVLAERFGLGAFEDAAFASLSAGQRQRVAVALAFVNDPDVVSLDEPTSGLDARARRDVYAAVRAMRDEGRTVVLTTHYIQEAEHLCDRVAVMCDGRIVSTGTPAELVASVRTLPRVTVRTAPAIEEADVRVLPGVTRAEPLTPRTAAGAEAPRRAPVAHDGDADLASVPVFRERSSRAASPHPAPRQQHGDREDGPATASGGAGTVAPPAVGAWQLSTSDVGRTIVALVKLLEARSAELIDLEVRRPTLEDAFVELTGRPASDADVPTPVLTTPSLATLAPPPPPGPST